MLVHGRLRKQQHKQAKYANKRRKNITYKIGDPLLYKKHVRSKLEGRWRPFYRIIEQKSPVNYVLCNQLDGKNVESHAGDIKLAKVDDWHIPETEIGQPCRKAIHVAPPVSDESSSDAGSDESEPENAQEKLVRRACHEREDSAEENEIPIMELTKRIRERMLREDEQAYVSEEMQSADEADSDATIDYAVSDSMLIEKVHKVETEPENVEQTKSKRTQRSGKDHNIKLRTLLSTIAEMI